jgi:hypothetical protein
MASLAESTNTRQTLSLNLRQRLRFDPRRLDATLPISGIHPSLAAPDADKQAREACSMVSTLFGSEHCEAAITEYPAFPVKIQEVHCHATFWSTVEKARRRLSLSESEAPRCRGEKSIAAGHLLPVYNAMRRCLRLAFHSIITIRPLQSLSFTSILF